ncbi:hypothetical protein L4D76_14700 [Photobacterium sagamiensis]|uniref:CBU_0592 family membrane protein n=1 Tax=Photobacterium sagamiensis TaxID=2910241 RepID=UPI003D100E29
MDILFLGWLGAGLYLSAFALLSLKIIPANKLYLLLNTLGSSLLIIYSLVISSYQIAVINSLWIIISLLAHKKKLPVFQHVDNRTFAAGFIGLLVGQIGALYHQNMTLVIDMLGWISTWIYLAGYSLFLSENITLHQYRCWGVIAPLTILPVLYIDQNWPNFASNTIWMIVALISLFRSRQVRTILPC